MESRSKICFIMSLEKLLCWTLISLLFTSGGLVQNLSPSQCGKTFQIEQDRMDVYIMPGVVNCFSCALDTNGSVAWQVTVDGSFVPVSSLSDAGIVAATFENLLIIAMPGNYVLPGTSGRQDILCTLDNVQTLEARLASPILIQPLFADATVNEGDLLQITCVTRNIPDITTFEILSPNGMPLPTTLGVFAVYNVTRAFAGTYTCVVTSTLDNSTVNGTSEVTIEYSHPGPAALQDDHENRNQLLPILLSATVIPVVVLIGIVSILGIAFVYLVSKKPIRLKRQTHQWSLYDKQFEMGSVATNEQETKGQKSREATADFEIQQDSRTDHTLIYADVGPNTFNKLQKFTVIDDSSYRVQYATIDHNAKAPISELPTTGDELRTVDLDSLLILLKEELAPRWYDFGLVVGVPKELMDSYTGYLSDQCLTEVLDYWLRHHFQTDQLTWTDVAHALRAIKLDELADKVLLQVSSMTPNTQNATGSLSVKRDYDDDCHALSQGNVAVIVHDMADVNGPELPPKPKPYVDGAIKVLPAAAECEDTAQDQPDVQPPPLPPKSDLL